MSVELKNLKKYINFPNTSSAFKDIMNNYKKKLKYSRAFNKDIILRQIYSKIHQLEKGERENDFIISEVRRNAQINQEILYSFGTKALNHLGEVRKINVSTKIDKSIFLGIDEYKKKPQKKSIYNFNEDKKFIILPKIIKNKNKTGLNERYKTTSKEKQNIYEINKYKNFVNNTKIDNKRSKYINNNSQNSKDEKNLSFNNITPIKKSKETSNNSILSLKAPLITERESKTKYSNRKASPRIDDEYINYIKTMSNIFSETEKKQEQYFYKNKYGIDMFKLKYNHLTKKFFN